ncbi:MAG TPA: ATP-binding protein, partial [Ignavibacteriaceae bacterium]|nr:ATP-binding protein [Ignavibacteriaceae bacterium]
SDGLIGKDFKNAAFRTPNDLMFFGSNAGLNVFDPKGIRQSDYFPHIYITGFQIFNQPVPVGKESPLKTNITQAKEILLSYNQNVFSFQFSSLDYNSPQSNQYAYMMEGFDDDWIFSGSRRFVTYTNLDPGKYIFKVKATNSDGIWSKNEASLKVIIIPPWWKTAWAYSLYIFLIIAGVLGIRKFQINRAELRNELKMSEFEAKKHQELENLKSRFFANLSHEFRTPLMLIKGPVEQLLSSKLPQKLSENRRLAAEDEIEQLKMVRRNAQKLQELIDQLLELSQLEASSIPLKARQENLITLLHGMVSGFELLANQKNIKLVFHAGADTICAWVDNDKLEKIINNLLSNAFKFTQPGGTVAVLVQQNEKTEEAEIKITDTGIGIPDDHLNKIFNRFYQVDDSSRREFGGSGIGLSLVKELVDLHKWKISVRSEPGKGTEFSIKIPLSNSYLEEEEKIFEIQPGITGPKKNESGLNQILQEKSSDYAAGKILSENINNLAGISKDSSGRPLILIVEDSDDVRKYLIDILKSVYNLAEAENGEEGLRLTIEKMPDLILSDVMMPKMDGMEFCHRIKSNWETSHIPVIMLTAKASTENRLEGLETGADDYLTKPFDTKELYIRIRNLLEQHRRLREKFSKDINISAGTLAVNKADNEFLRKAFAVTEKNVSNADFNSEMFASEMYVSRSQLHRKLIAVTGEAPGEFIRSIRLKFAARLLLEKNLSVTQIALEVGFSSPSHFTKAFQLQFGCLPSEFKSRV